MVGMVCMIVIYKIKSGTINIENHALSVHYQRSSCDLGRRTISLIIVMNPQRKRTLNISTEWEQVPNQFRVTKPSAILMTAQKKWPSALHLPLKSVASP